VKAPQAHPDDGNIDNGKMHKGPVTQDEAVAPGDRLRLHLVAHNHDQDEHINKICDGIGKEQQNESVQAEACDDAPDGAANPDPCIAGHA
jgi:hypothetical protein